MVAKKLMNSYKLIVNHEGEYRIAEVEFYLKNEDAHKDTFTHCDPIQAKNGKWYFHRMNPTNPMSFKAGTYKGMDLTFGGEKVFGGILIRALYNIKTKQYIDGPCNTVKEIL
jgi:hypothetical protein